MLEFLGCIVGKVLYEGILLEYFFLLFFVLKFLGWYSFFDEFLSLDVEFY